MGGVVPADDLPSSPSSGAPVPQHDLPEGEPSLWDKTGGAAVKEILGFGKGLAGAAADAFTGTADLIGDTMSVEGVEPPKVGEAQIEKMGTSAVQGVADNPSVLFPRIDQVVTSAAKEARDVLTDRSGESAGRLAFDLAPFAGAAGKVRKAETAISELRSDPVRHHEIAAEHAKLPRSESVETPVGQDLDTRIRTTATTKADALKSTKITEGKQAFDRYFLTGEQIEKGGAYFTTSEPGIKLIEELSKIESGGTGAGTEFSKAMRASAKRLREALSGVDPMGRKPANLRVVDEELRALRAKQYDTKPGGFDEVQRERFGKLADKLEESVKKWVGEENYPREEYAALSSDLNKYNSKLGKELVGKQKLKYVKEGEAPYKVQSGVSDRVFASRETVAEAKSLIGETEVNSLAEQRLSNEFRGKTSAQQLDWLDKNPWTKDIPGLNEKAMQHIRVMAEREGNAESLRRWKKRAAYAAATAATAAGAGEVYRMTAH